MKRSFAFILFIASLVGFSTSAGWSQTGKIRGTISDKATGEVLMFTNVSIKDDSTLIGGAQTDLDGNYEIAAQPGTYNLEVSYVGYNTNTIT